MRRPSIAPMVCAVALVAASPAAAVDWVDPTPEQTARCERQTNLKERNDCLWAYSVRGLQFPDEAEEPGFFTNTARMGIFKPAGPGPFPALILLHTCAAVDIDPQHMPFWVAQAIKHGFVAFVVDSWTQRDIRELCTGAPVGFLRVHILVRTRDAYDALAHVAKFDFVDKSRIAAMGFSMGGRVAYQIARKPPREMYSSSSLRFGASVAVYGKCVLDAPRVHFLAQDVDRPLLTLLGDLDRDGDPNVCVPLLQDLKAKGAPVEWHVFPQTGHAWDQPKHTRPRTVAYLGNTDGVLFAYDARVTEESRAKAFDFLARHLK